MSDLHHLCLPGQGDEWWLSLAGVGQSAVNIELQVDVGALETPDSQDDGVSPSISQVSVLQVHSVDLPISFDITNQR